MQEVSPVMCIAFPSLGTESVMMPPAGEGCGEVQQMTYGGRAEAACAELPPLPGSCGNVDYAVRRSQVGVIKIW